VNDKGDFSMSIVTTPKVGEELDKLVKAYMGRVGEKSYAVALANVKADPANANLVRAYALS
jgi:hypothetical protein